MAPPPGTAVRPALQAGDVLAGRYRLEHPVRPAEDGSPAVLWRAQDEVLARPVAATLLRADGVEEAAAAQPFLEAAATVGALATPVLARVYDAAVERRRVAGSDREVDVAYVISEWVDGRDLATVLREDGPLEPRQAVTLTATAAEALQSAHARGLVHGRVHPGNVLLLADGRVRLTGTATAAALPGRAVPAARADDPTGAEADVRDLTAVLYALLTGRWPATATPQPSCGVPAAPATSDGRSRGRLTSPRQVRAGVPRALDDLVSRVLSPVPGRSGPATAAALADALEASVRAEPVRLPVPARSRTPSPLQRRLPLLAGALLVLVVGAGAYAVGREIGEVPPLDDGLAALVTPPPGTPAPTGARVDLSAATVVDFDPPPGSGDERSGAVPNAYDDDPSSVWETERYNTASFGGLKTGVGLLVDLGEPTELSRVELATTGGGAAFELRTADARGETAEDYRVVASGTAQEEGLVLEPPAGTTARYVLVWATSLRETEGGFKAGVAEMRFLGG